MLTSPSPSTPPAQPHCGPTPPAPPAPATPPARTWTADVKVRFLDRLAVHGNVRAACRAVGFSPESAYRQRRNDPVFARGWASAVLQGRENNAQVLAERALEGVEEEVWYRGELVGTRRRYDNRLLLAHLARLDRMVEELGDEGDDLDEILALIAGELPPGSTPEMPHPDRDTYVQLMIDSAVDGMDQAAGHRRASAAHKRERKEAGNRAFHDAHREWDAWLARARERLEAIVSRPPAPPTPGLPGNPLPPAARAALASCAAPAKEALPFSPRTASYASTSALAQALAASSGRRPFISDRGSSCPPVRALKPSG